MKGVASAEQRVTSASLACRQCSATSVPASAAELVRRSLPPSSFLLARFVSIYSLFRLLWMLAMGPGAGEAQQPRSAVIRSLPPHSLPTDSDAAATRGSAL